MDRVIWHTLSSADWYQHFIPIYCYSVHKAYPQDRVMVGVTGKLDDITTRAMAHVRDCQIRIAGEGYLRTDGVIVSQNVLLDIPQNKKSVLNTLRFLVHPGSVHYWDYTMTTDIDLIVFPCKPTHLQWHKDRMEETKQPFAGHHGPWKKPQRFPGGWVGFRERVAGGYFCYTPNFYYKTESFADNLLAMMKADVQPDYREFDEVTLCQMIKACGWKVPKRGFNQDLRGIHLGDFREDMKHRHTNMSKMAKKLSDPTARKFVELLEDPVFNKIVDICCECDKFKAVWKNLLQHLKLRGYPIFGSLVFE